MWKANFIRVQIFRVYEPLLAAALVYIALTFVLTRGFRVLERRLNRDRLQPIPGGTAHGGRANAKERALALTIPPTIPAMSEPPPAAGRHRILP